MEPTKAQKNSALINDMKAVREAIALLSNKINGNSPATHRMLGLLREVDHSALDRLVELGMSITLKENKEA